MTLAEMKKKVRKESGIRYTRQPLTIRQWARWAKAHNYTRIADVGYAIEWGANTGRLPNLVTTEEGCFFALNYKMMTNGQVADAIARAALQGGTESATLKSLQKAMGIKVR